MKINPAAQVLITIITLATTTCAGKSTQPTPLTSTQETNKLLLVPAGWFLQGENDGRRSNQPQRRVYVDAFYIQKTEVTREAFQAFILATGYQAPGWDKQIASQNPTAPVVGVLWKDAAAYCQWANMRLPREAEWEKAARGQDGLRYPWGNEWDSQKANTAENGFGDTRPVGSYPEGVSPYGALDMAGNALEWVSDYYDPEYYRTGPQYNPTGPPTIMDHILRGGSFAAPHTQATTYFRDSSHSVRPNFRVGFRCARPMQ